MSELAFGSSQATRNKFLVGIDRLFQFVDRHYVVVNFGQSPTGNSKHSDYRKYFSAARCLPGAHARCCCRLTFRLLAILVVVC